MRRTTLILNQMFNGKNVLLGVTGSISAYKATYIVRLLKKIRKLSVKVIQTESSLNFVSPLVLSTLSENKVITSVIDNETNQWINHVDLGIWADLMIIANTAKLYQKW